MERTWIIDGDPVLAEPGEELVEAIFEASRLLDRVGGVIIMAAQREQVGPDLYQTVNYLFRWHSYMPAKRMEQPADDQAEPVVAAA